jgi:hypothetical protein
MEAPVTTTTFPVSFSFDRSEEAMPGLYLAWRGKSRRDYNYGIDIARALLPTPPFHLRGGE